MDDGDYIIDSEGAYIQDGDMLDEIGSDDDGAIDYEAPTIGGTSMTHNIIGLTNTYIGEDGSIIPDESEIQTAYDGNGAETIPDLDYTGISGSLVDADGPLPTAPTAYSRMTPCSKSIKPVSAGNMITTANANACVVPVKVVKSAAIPITGRANPIFITGKMRKTSPIMTTFEYARIIGARATEIEKDAKNIDPKVEKLLFEHKIDNAIDIATFELESIDSPHPMSIFRPVQSANVYEVWPVRDLILPTRIACLSYSTRASELLLGKNKLSGRCDPPVEDGLIRFPTNVYKNFAKYSVR